MGLPTWAKCKLEENWPASLTEAIMKVEGFSDVGRGESPDSKRIASSLIRKHAMKGNGTKAKTPQRGKAQTIPRFGFQTQRKFCQEGGSFQSEPTQGRCHWETQRSMFQL
jgi:hypothetical protein